MLSPLPLHFTRQFEGKMTHAERREKKVKISGAQGLQATLCSETQKQGIDTSQCWKQIKLRLRQRDLAGQPACCDALQQQHDQVVLESVSWCFHCSHCKGFRRTKNFRRQQRKEPSQRHRVMQRFREVFSHETDHLKNELFRDCLTEGNIVAASPWEASRTKPLREVQEGLAITDQEPSGGFRHEPFRNFLTEELENLMFANPWGPFKKILNFLTERLENTGSLKKNPFRHSLAEGLNISANLRNESSRHFLTEGLDSSKTFARKDWDISWPRALAEANRCKHQP